MRAPGPFLKLLFHVHGYKPAYHYGGPIYSVSSLAEGLVKRGHEVFVATGNRNLAELLDVDPERVYERDGVKVRYFPTRLSIFQELRIPYFSKSAMFQFGPSFEQWLKTNAAQFDLFHTHMAFVSGSSLVSRTAKRLRKLYFYHQRGNLDPVRLRFRRLKKLAYLRLIEEPVMRRADLLLALGNHEVSSYRALGLRNRIEVLPNGIDSEFETRPAKPVASLERFLTSSGNQLLFLFLSRIHPMKGADLFVDSFIQYAQTHAEGRAVLAGPDEFGMLPRFREKIEKHGLTHRFLTPGPVEGDTKMALLKSADLFVFPTHSEGFSIVLLEAMACGCAVLTTPGAHFDEIEEAGAGLIVKPGVAAVLGGMRQLGDGGRLSLKAMGAKGKTLVLQKYTWPTIVPRYEDLALELYQQRVANAQSTASRN